MRIIKEGKKPVEEWQVTCDKCGCVFAFDRSDIHSDQREGNWVYCPTCNAVIDVTYRGHWNNGVRVCDNRL